MVNEPPRHRGVHYSVGGGIKAGMLPRFASFIFWTASCRHRRCPTLARLAVTTLRRPVIMPDRETRNPGGLSERVDGRGDDEDLGLLFQPRPHDGAELRQLPLLPV